MILLASDTNSIAVGADCIRAGGLLGLPTETVYGLAADADNDAAVAQIFAAKGRPADHPLIVHVADASAVNHYASAVPDFARALMAAFWPGPLTLILPRRPGIANAAAGGNPTIGLRCPSHPVAQALLLALKKVNWGQIPINLAGVAASERELESNPNLFGVSQPVIASEARPSMHSVALGDRIAGAPRHDGQRVWGLAAPSANQFGRVSPTTAAHVQGEFGNDLLILDGGPCSVGIESSIIDCTRGQPVLLRPGAITPEQIRLVCGLKVLLNKELPALSEKGPKASGTLDSHYAPRARVRLMEVPALQAELTAAAAPTAGAEPAKGSLKPAIAVWSRSAVAVPTNPVICRRMPADPATAAQQLFATLRELDGLGVSQIWIEAPPETPEWDGVRDRLQRAAY